MNDSFSVKILSVSYLVVFRLSYMIVIMFATIQGYYNEVETLLLLHSVSTVAAIVGVIVGISQLVAKNSSFSTAFC